MAERKPRHLLETAIALLFQTYVPKQFILVDVVSITCFLINLIPSTVLHDQVPYKILFPDKFVFLIEPRIFRCTCFVYDIILRAIINTPLSNTN